MNLYRTQCIALLNSSLHSIIPGHIIQGVDAQSLIILKTNYAFVFSENYIFGKFDAFCKRLEKIDDMLNTMENLSGLTTFKLEVRMTSAIMHAQ